MGFSLPVYGKDDFLEINPSKIIGLGLNYSDHFEEYNHISSKLSNDKLSSNFSLPTEPIIFSKTPNSLIGPEEKIIIPKFLNNYHFDDPRIDIEGELALIIKKTCKNISKEQSLNYILGYTCFNDITHRNIQNIDRSGWFRGKSFDTFGPIGPQIVLSEDLVNPQNLDIKSRLNGKICQNSNTKMMIFDIPSIIEFISHNLTLKRGDIIITGTPKGVSSIKPDDIVEIEIEKIGILKNQVIGEI